MTLGIDIGGTNLCLGLVRDGAVAHQFSTPSFRKEASLQETLDYLSEQISRILSPETRRIGIGVPSVLDVDKGIIYDATNIPSWKEVPLKEYLQGRFSIPVAINNDANCYAMGAYGKYPADEKPDTLVGITLGTGVGMGIVIDGKLFCGATCGAGELCCLPYRDGIIEDYTSKKFFTMKNCDSYKAGQAALAGDPEAINLFEEFGRHMGALLIAVLLAYDPSHIALGGGIARAFNLFAPAMMAYLKKHYPYQKALEKLDIRPITDDDVLILGASLL